MENIVFKIESTEPERTPSPEVAEIEPATMEKIVLKEFILKYEALPELWDNFSQHYQNSIRRGVALSKLLKIYKKIKSDATVDDVKKKINSIRSNFRREWNKLEASKRSRDRTGFVYKPRSWAFHLLTFLKKKGQPLTRRTSTASEDSESEGQHRDTLGRFTSLPPPPKRWKQPITEQSELEQQQNNKTFSSFSPHSVNAPIDRTPSFLPQSVNAPLEQPHSFLSKSVQAPLEQPHSFLPKSVQAPLEQPHSFLPKSVHAPLEQPHSFLPKSVHAPLEQPHSFLPQSVNAPLEQPHSFLPQSVNAPLEQPHSFLPKSVHAPLEQPHSFLPKSVHAPLEQPHSFLPQSVNAPLEQPHSFVSQSVSAPLEQPHSFVSQSVNAPSTVHTLTPTALYWSHKLDNLNRTQRLYAEKYINEILLEAELGNLGRNSVLINSSDQIETPKLSAVYSVCHPTPSSSDK